MSNNDIATLYLNEVLPQVSEIISNCT